MYLESDTISGNFKVGITNFSHYTSTTIYTLHRDKVFAALPLKIVTFTPSNSVLCGTLQNTAFYKVPHRIFGSTL